LSRLLHRLAGTVILVATGAIVTRLLPLGIEPSNSAEARYVSNALEMRHMLNSHPVQRIIGGLLVLRISVSDLRQVPGSCSDGNPDIIGMEDGVATVTDHTIFAIPLACYQVTCAGNAITRGSKDWAARRKLPPPSTTDEEREAVITAPPPPPSPPAPGVSLPPAP
jgi:hypothetical protein